VLEKRLTRSSQGIAILRRSLFITPHGVILHHRHGLCGRRILSLVCGFIPTGAQAHGRSHTQNCSATAAGFAKTFTMHHTLAILHSCARSVKLILILLAQKTGTPVTSKTENSIFLQKIQIFACLSPCILARMRSNKTT
jgi:hypothetical protein